MYSIAIDGPSGAGKSTLARRLADELGFCYLDTGAIYRTVGLYAARAGIDPDKLEPLDGCFIKMGLTIRHAAGIQRMFLCEEDVTDAIRTPEASRWAAIVAAHPPVRAFLLETQRKFARENSCILDGRDIGTVVLPNASVKIFLTASAEKRAERRYQELITRGMETTFEEVLREVNYRDAVDENRPISPTRSADDAVTLDTTEMDFTESFAALRAIVLQKIGER